MADRQDIDALMVGALYGELDAAERTRLEAHLSSHPEDRAAMQGLEDARAAVRRGMTEMPSADPPQAVSAILLQEAARRRGAVTATEPAEREGIWERFVAWFRPLSQRPALGAALMLILVAGTATALWVRGKGKDSNQTVSSQPERVAFERAAADEAPGGGDQPAAATGSSAGTAVVLTEPAAPPASDDPNLDNHDTSLAEKKTAGGKSTGSTGSRTRKPGTEMGIEVDSRSDKPTVKDLDEESQPIAQEDSAGVPEGYAKTTAANGAARAPEPEPIDPKLEEWAQVQHEKLVKYVKEGDCPNAGRVGAQIKAKAPDYYAANVAQDRDVRQCKQYIEKQVKKAAEKNYKSRSQSGNTYDDDADLEASE